MPKILTFIDKGSSQELYRDTLKTLMVSVIGIPEDELSFEYWPGNDGAVNKIDSYNPDIVFVCGEEALNHTLRVKGIKRMSGQIKEWNGRMIVPLLSPGYISSHPSELAPYAESIQRAYMVAGGEEIKEPENEFEIIHTFQELLPYLPYLSNASVVSFDFETTTLTDMGTFDPNFRLRGLALTYQIGSAIFLDLEDMSADDIRHVAMALDEKVFGNPDIIKIGHYVKFDMHCAVKLGIKQFKGRFHCTMLMAQLLDETTPNGLKYLVSVHFPAFAGYEKKLQGTKWEDIPMEILAPYGALDSDLTLRLYVYFTNIMLKEHPRVYNLFRTLTVPATMALFQAEQNGMLIDRQYLNDAIVATEADIIEQEQKLRHNKTVKKFQAHRDEVFKHNMITKLEDKIVREGEREFAETPADCRDKRVSILEQELMVADIAQQIKIQARITKEKEKKYGPTPKEASLNRIAILQLKINAWKTGSVTSSEPINFASPLQMNELIYGIKGFAFDPPQDPITGELKSGTGKEVLNYIRDKSSFLDNLLAYRQLTKILSTYLISIRDKMGKDNKIHSSFNQHIAKTGRLSSNNPNLQNIIARTKYEVVEEAVKRVKRSFTVPEGYTLTQADYSQAELRLIAHYSQDKRMMKAYLADQDLHEITAANAKGLSLAKWKELDDKERKESRFEAKAENFGLIYGMSAGGYRDYARVQYGIIMGKKKAEERRNDFFDLYPGLLSYHHTYKAKARKFGYVRTLFGRKVRLPDLKSFNRIKVGHAERNAINSPIQGTAGEMTIFAFALLQPILDKRVIFVNTIHDSILYYIPDDILEETINLIKIVMENLPIETYFDMTLSLPMKADFESSKESWGWLQ